MGVGFEFRGIRRHRRRPLRKRGSEPSRGTYGPVPLKSKVATEREGQPSFFPSATLHHHHHYHRILLLFLLYTWLYFIESRTSIGLGYRLDACAYTCVCYGYNNIQIIPRNVNHVRKLTALRCRRCCDLNLTKKKWKDKIKSRFLSVPKRHTLE